MTEAVVRLVEPVTERLARLDPAAPRPPGGPAAPPTADPVLSDGVVTQRIAIQPAKGIPPRHPIPRPRPDAPNSPSSQDITQRFERLAAPGGPATLGRHGPSAPTGATRSGIRPGSPVGPSGAPPSGDTAEPSGDPLRRRQISHDIHHELGTIMMLASLLSSAPDVGPQSQERARQILGESRWLDQLHRAYEATLPSPAGPAPAPRPAPIRLDLVAEEIVAAMRLSTMTKVTLTAVEAWARADRLAYWRAVRNVVGNAVRAAGPRGHVHVQVTTEDGWVVSQIDDDGPGFGAAPPGFGSLGLGIVQDAAVTWGGELEIRRGVRGGCCVRLKLPLVTPGGGALDGNPRCAC